MPSVPSPGNQTKPRILIISGVVPSISRGGGCLAMHRHFVERADFEILVAGTELDSCSAANIHEIRQSRVAKRLRRGVLQRILFNLDFVLNWYVAPTELIAAAKSWKPDVVFTVPDNIHTGLAYQVAGAIGVPLVVNYQDLFPLSQFLPIGQRPFPAIAKWLMRRYRLLNHRADLVFYTSEGMRDWFGGARNGHVLYPIGAQFPVSQESPVKTSSRAKVVYAGNCYGAYGRMLLRLADHLQAHPSIEFSIYAAGNDWKSFDLERLQACGIYRGFIPFDKLKDVLLNADAFLTVMSFEALERSFVQTSFTTKWLDYAPCGKPVFVWGPSYSSAAVFACESRCGAVISEDDPTAVARAIEDALADPEATLSLSESSIRVAKEKLSASSIHQILVQLLNMLLSESRNSEIA